MTGLLKNMYEMFLPCSLTCFLTVKEHIRTVKEHSKTWDQNFKNAVF